MTKQQYLESLFEAWESGKISDEAYDQSIINMEEFADD